MRWKLLLESLISPYGTYIYRVPISYTDYLKFSKTYPREIVYIGLIIKLKHIKKVSKTMA